MTKPQAVLSPRDRNLLQEFVMENVFDFSAPPADTTGHLVMLARAINLRRGNGQEFSSENFLDEITRQATLDNLAKPSSRSKSPVPQVPQTEAELDAVAPTQPPDPARVALAIEWLIKLDTDTEVPDTHKAAIRLQTLLRKQGESFEVSELEAALLAMKGSIAETGQSAESVPETYEELLAAYEQLLTERSQLQARIIELETKLKQGGNT